MKIKYQFTNEAVTIEVEDQWATVLVDLDREEYNDNHRETRRHCSLDALNQDDTLIPSDTNVEADILTKCDYEQLHTAISKLQPQQRELVMRVHFGGEKLADIARAEGVSKMALTNRMKKIYASLQKKMK